MNKRIQQFWIALVSIILLFSILNQGALIFGMLVAPFLGGHQLAVSFANYMKFGKQTAYKYHLLISILYILYAFIIPLVSTDLGYRISISDRPEGILIGVPIILAIYFWVITFTEKGQEESKSVDNGPLDSRIKQLTDEL